MTPSLHTEKPGRVIESLTRLIACDDLPGALPDDPMPLLTAWFEDARNSGRYDNYNAMTLATATPDGAPSARIVLCKAIEIAPPALMFYTSYASRKGEELEANPRAAAVFHWPHAMRQARVEGRVRRTTDAESDAYFRTRPLLSRIGANVSPQSRAIESREGVIGEAVRIGVRAAMGAAVSRPAEWGGYRIIPERIELWSAAGGRLHDRALWRRDIDHDPDAWSVRRLGA